MVFITDWVLKRKAATVLITLLISLLGIFALTQLKSELVPDIQFPFLTVTTR
jgi:multidrug efflux pump subunit AcrB